MVGRIGGSPAIGPTGRPDRCRIRPEERIPAQAGVPVAAVGVEDPELRPPPRRSEPVPGDDHLRPLADDIPPEPDPRPADELEPETGRLAERLAEARREVGRLEDDEHRPGPAGERGESLEPLGDRWCPAAGRATGAGAAAGPAGRRARGTGDRLSGRQVDQQEVDRPPLDEHPRHRQAVVDRVGREDDEPIEANPARDRLDRIEAPGEIEPGDDRTARLGLGREAESERRLAAREIAPDGDARLARETAAAEDRVEDGEPGPDDPAVSGPFERGLRRTRGSRRARGRTPGPFRQGHRLRQGDRRQGPDHLADRARPADRIHLPDRAPRPAEPARSCRAPARLEGRQDGCDVVGAGAPHGLHDRTSVRSFKPRKRPGRPQRSPIRTTPTASIARPNHCTRRSRSPRMTTATRTAIAGPNELDRPTTQASERWRPVA